ncbi:MAG: sulfur transferase domain-containing protein, partial [Paracoccaceae bacterium]|nr:sulfur transferase domain-containing protein [Paracoccaceae bacterium]
MQLKQITPDVCVTGQILPEQVAALASQGFKALICNRPDNEADDQPSFAEVESAAKAAGLEIRYIPIVHGQVTMVEVADFRNAIDTLPKPLV